MNTIHAIANWVYFTFNHPEMKSVFVSIYGECLGSHIYSKWIGYDCNFNKLLVELTTHNQVKLIDWVNKNYHGVSPERYESEV